MSFKLLGGGSDLNQVVSDVNANILELKGEEIRKIIKDEDGTRVMVLDKYGLRTTSPGSGVDVIEASDNDLTYDSRRQSYRFIDTLTLSLTFTRTSSTFASYVTSSNHGLSFVPSILYNLQIDANMSAIPPGQKFPGMYVFSANVGGAYTPFGQAYCTVDSTKVYFQIDVSSLSSGTYTCTAYVDLLQKPFG